MKSDIHMYVLSTEPNLRDFCEMSYSINNIEFLVNCEFSMYFQIFFDLNTLKALTIREFLIDNWIFWKAHLKMSQSS